MRMVIWQIVKVKNFWRIKEKWFLALNKQTLETLRQKHPRSKAASDQILLPDEPSQEASLSYIYRSWNHSKNCNQNRRRIWFIKYGHQWLEENAVSITRDYITEWVTSLQVYAWWWLWGHKGCLLRRRHRRYTIDYWLFICLNYRNFKITQIWNTERKLRKFSRRWLWFWMFWFIKIFELQKIQIRES